MMDQNNNGDTEDDQEYCGGESISAEKGLGGAEMIDKDKRKKLGSPSSSAAGIRAARGVAAAAAAAAACCQAERCGADLSEAKRYHRRHKVCEPHSKAAVVPVAGLRQRFCQQCSRFHELSEFDEAKRSCRRRLAGHNERRRKSSVECYGEGSAAKITSNNNKEAQYNGDGTDPSRSAKFQNMTLPGNSQYNKHYHIN